jgi:hypothetical protein
MILYCIRSVLLLLAGIHQQIAGIRNGYPATISNILSVVVEVTVKPMFYDFTTGCNLKLELHLPGLMESRKTRHTLLLLSTAMPMEAR